MSYLYVTENGASLNIDGGYFVVTHKDGMLHKIPKEQKSAFEMILTKSQYNELIAKIPSYITDEDNVRVYKLKISGEIVSWGSGMTEAEEVIII